MKKLIILCFLIFTSCIEEIIETVPPPTIIESSIFDIKESKVTDGQTIYFELPAAGVYTLTLIDKETNQVVSREKFNGTVGKNIKKIYTSSIQSQYLYMLLENVAKKEISKTIIITK
jgi:hypothetical protein